jgi:hypothetical protein
MAKLSFYEQVGILIPGVIFLAVLLVIVPGANAFLSPKNISVGEFGIFIITAYAVGHAIAAVGNLLESIWWKIRGGMPTEWVIYDDERIVSAAQKQKLAEKVKSYFGLPLTNIIGMDRRRWRPISRQVYRYSLTVSAERIEVFNGNYGLNRGLAAALFSLAVLNEAVQPQHYVFSLSLIVGGLVYCYRMNRYAVHFAREVFLIFLNSKAPSPDAPEGI